MRERGKEKDSHAPCCTGRPWYWRRVIEGFLFPLRERRRGLCVCVCFVLANGGGSSWRDTFYPLLPHYPPHPASLSSCCCCLMSDTPVRVLRAAVTRVKFSCSSQESFFLVPTQ